jgi:hypothetical protein
MIQSDEPLGAHAMSRAHFWPADLGVSPRPSIESVNSMPFEEVHKGGLFQGDFPG